MKITPGLFSAAIIIIEIIIMIIIFRQIRNAETLSTTFASVIRPNLRVETLRKFFCKVIYLDEPNSNDLNTLAQKTSIGNFGETFLFHDVFA